MTKDQQAHMGISLWEDNGQRSATIGMAEANSSILNLFAPTSQPLTAYSNNQKHGLFNVENARLVCWLQ